MIKKIVLLLPLLFLGCGSDNSAPSTVAEKIGVTSKSEALLYCKTKYYDSFCSPFRLFLYFSSLRKGLDDSSLPLFSNYPSSRMIMDDYKSFSYCDSVDKSVADDVCMAYFEMVDYIKSSNYVFYK